jgi:hypothetical protein
MPTLHPVKNGTNEFLFGAIFPPLGEVTPVPDELLAQLRGRTNLIYYDWEITEERLIHAKQLYQLACMADSRYLPSTNSASKRWLAAVGPKLGNTVTEIVQSNPQELTLVRKSHLGWTGFELVTLSTWLDSPGFPFAFELPHIWGKPSTNAVSGKTAAPPAGKASPSAKTNAPPATKR